MDSKIQILLYSNVVRRMDQHWTAIALTLIITAALAAPSVRAAARPEKLSLSIRQALDSSDPIFQHRLWVFLDLTNDQLERVPLSQRALERRAKVDPIDFLIDDRDYRPDNAVIQRIEETGATVRFVSRWLKAVVVDADATQTYYLTELPDVVVIDRVKTLARRAPDLKTKSIPQQRLGSAYSLPYGASLYQNEFTRAVKLHEAGLSGNGVLIAMFDSGFDPNLPAFDSTDIVATHDFVEGDSAVDEIGCPAQAETNYQNYHGTATLGVIAANWPDTVVGSAVGASFLLAKTEMTCPLTDGTNWEEIKAEEHNWIAAAEWADSAGADIITSSVGYYLFEDFADYDQSQLDGATALITNAADLAASKNILVINSAGNERLKTWGTIIFPADGDSVIAVGAVRPDSTLASFSSPGPSADGRVKPDIATLGVSVATIRALDGSQFDVGGTSFSAPLVAAGAALAMEHDPTMTAAEARDLIRQTGSMSDSPDNDFGYGLYDAAKAADIIKVDQAGVLRVERGTTAVFDITTSGRSAVTPTLSLFDPALTGFTLLDNGDGTGSLEVFGSDNDNPSVQIGLIADVGYFTDTTYLIIETYAVLAEPVVAAPNPFSDSVRILFSGGTDLGAVQSVTVFNDAGEKVWEYVNHSGSSTDRITWDGRNGRGEATAAGVYILYVRTARHETRLKLLKTG
jgi:hypothetical protein